MRPFTIVVCDDDMEVEILSSLRRICPQADVWHVEHLGRGHRANPSLAHSAQPATRWSDDTLLHADVLILDMGMECHDEDWQIPSDVLKKISPDYGGARFLLGMYDRLNVQVVFVCTGFDAQTRQIDHLTRDTEGMPRVLKFEKEGGEEFILGMVHSMYEAYCGGYTDLSDQGAIEFAASHDESVLILGEPGTGKEYVARAIHRRWALEKSRDLGGFSQDVTPCFRPFNCAGLSPDLSRGELFGWVRGSFTGAADHRLGECLIASGLRSFSSPQKEVKSVDLVDEFVRLLTEANPGLIDCHDKYDLELRCPFAVGTLFLDEFGDLHPAVQALLLRYLQSQEVKPLGFPGILRGVKARIIAATSDPAVAAMVGQTVWSRSRTLPGTGDAFREDLVSRVNAQVIRVTPVDDRNARDVLARMIESSSKRSWDQAAVDHVVQRIEELTTEARRAADVGDLEPRCVFGHRRELARLIKVANTYMDTAEKRGIKGLGQHVSREIVEKVWRTSSAAGSVQGRVAKDTLKTPQSTFTLSSGSMIIDLDHAKDAVEYVRQRLAGQGERQAPGKLGSNQLSAAIFLVWFALFHGMGDEKENEVAQRIFLSSSQKNAHRTVRETAKTVLDLPTTKTIAQEASSFRDWSKSRGIQWHLLSDGSTSHS